MRAWRPLVTSLTWVGVGALAAASCASPPPRDAIAQADEAISRAKAEDAAQHAPLALRKAEDKLASAKEAARDDDHYGKSRRLAEQAEVDAQLALAEAQRAKAEKSQQELQRTIDALEEEIHHDAR
jgi:hypothetical protein